MTREPNYFTDHWTMSEWLSTAERRESLLAEDRTKRGRLAILRRLMDVPSAVNRVFPSAAIVEGASDLLAFRDEAGQRPYALRMNPLHGGEVERQRGQTVEELINWARPLAVISEYSCDFEPHIASTQATIFVCTPSGVWGEYLEGPLLDLNRGAVGDRAQLFNEAWNSGRDEAPGLVRRALDALNLDDKARRTRVEAELGGNFFEGHLLGYFEAISDESGDLWFVDYNRLLMDDCPWGDASSVPSGLSGSTLRGRTGSRGRVRGVVVHADESTTESGTEPRILVAPATSPELLPAMSRSAGVVTEVGGVLSHAAIACRELGIPCVVGVTGATTALASGTWVLLDADEARVEVL